MKKRIDVIANEESYSNLSSFTDIEEMNETVRTYRDAIKAAIKRADVQTRLIALLELLKRHSCKNVGVSYMCKNTIAEKLELSYKTVQRLVKKLEELGTIRQIATKRKKDMLQTANAIVIVPAIGPSIGPEDNCGLKNDMADKTPVELSEKCPTIKTKPVSLKQKIKRLNKRNDSVVPSTDVEDNFSKANFIARWVPAAFAKLANYYFHEAKDIQELWKVVRQQNRIVDHIDNLRAFNESQELHIALTAFKEFVMKVKSGKLINNLFGYFNGIVNNLMSELIFDDEFMGRDAEFGC